MQSYEDFLRENGIEFFSSLPISECKLTRPYLLQKTGDFVPRSVLMLLLPYYAGETKNISVYASARDYHLYTKHLLAELSDVLQNQYEGYRFYGFSDHSPIDERDAAVKAGLGVFGDNGLLINDCYSSFVFLCEVVSDLPSDAFGETRIVMPRKCEGCGACKKACPTGILLGKSDLCLSAVTQKKGELTEEERELILRTGSVWGCDICQEACPYTKRAKEKGTLTTPIPFFREKRITELSEDILSEMSEEEFKERAFSWRGKEPLLRNLEILK